MLARRRLAAVALAFLLSSICLPQSAVATAAMDKGEMADVVATVSGERMLATVQDLEDFGSRAFYLQSSLDAAAYIYQRFDDLGLDVEYQPFSVHGYSAVNVVATLDGTSPGAPRYLFGAHFDSENMFVDTYSEGVNYSAPGADDDASGVAAVIELATLMADMTFENAVRFVAFDAEEYGFDQIGGLKGSAHFVSVEKASNTKYAATAILDMIGWRQGSDNVAFGIVNDDKDRFAAATQEAVSEFDLDLAFTAITAPTLSFSDHASFWNAGYPSMLVMEEIGYPSMDVLYPYYHTTSDTSDKVNPDQMEQVTKALLGAILLMVADEGSAIVLVVAAIVAAAVAVAVIAYVRINRKKEGRE